MLKNFSKKMTSVFLAIFTAIAVLTIFEAEVNAVETYVDEARTTYVTEDFEYELLDDGTAEITDYLGSAKVLEIPAGIDGYTVTSIGEWAFSGCTGLTSITIPDSVTSIGDFSFSGCTGLTSITIPNNVTSIGEWAFSGCTGLTSITIPDSVTSIGSAAFYDCIELKKMSVGENNPNYSSVDGVLFNKDCTELILYPNMKASEYTIPDSVTSIGESAFRGCTSIKNVTIPDSVTSIGYRAFSGCTSLTSITIPDSVTSIGSFSFSGCTSIKNVTIPDSVTSIGSFSFSGCTSLESITILDSVTVIRQGAFSGCVSLESITIPDSVTSIGRSAFSNCSSLKSITIPDGITTISSKTFEGCTNLTKITIPDTITSIESFAFNNTAWYNAQPDGVVYIGNFAYSYKGQMPENTSIELDDGTKGISAGAFYNCTSLISITIPASVTSIGEWAFSGCTGLMEFRIDTNNPCYSSLDGVLYDKDITNLIQYPPMKPCDTYTIPESVTSIGQSAFEDCSKLLSVIIPDSVTSIGEWAFSGCTGLTNIIIPNSVTSIEDRAFYDCTGLTSITIPDSVTSIGYMAFFGCTSLTSITIPNSVTSIGNGAFFDTAWYVNQPDGVVYAGKVAYDYKGEMLENTSLHLINGTRGIADNAFSGRTYLKSISIPDSVTCIGEYAFSYCTNLTNIDIPNGVTNIGGAAFSDTGWYNNQPDGVVYVGKVAYDYKGEMPENTKIDLIDDTVAIADYAFSGCSSFTSITIPDSVTSIGIAAFSYCTSLTDITIPDSVTSIGDYAFHDCTSLTSVSIPTSVRKIGNSAFGFIFYKSDLGNEKVENFQIIGYSDTAAEIYAKENGFAFVDLYEESVMFGDADGDSEINAKDRMTLTRYLAKWSGYETIDSSAADLNSDGEINAKDRMILTRHLAKWQGYEILPYLK